MKKILIIDDQPNIRMMIRLTLSDKFEIVEAHNAEMALKQIHAKRPDAIVLDVMMPGATNGFQLCEMVKKDPTLSIIYVILVTACGQTEDQELGRALGADGYFIKPFSPLALRQHLINALNVARAEE